MARDTKTSHERRVRRRPVNPTRRSGPPPEASTGRRGCGCGLFLFAALALTALAFAALHGRTR